MNREIKKVALLGANGTMGYGSGALFTLANCDVYFLARNQEKAEAGLKAAIKQVRSVSVSNRVTVGGYDELEKAIPQADLIFECVAENFEIKNEMFAKVDQLRKPDSIVATVSSGLSITKLAENRSESFRKNFLGLHYFNPPNVIVGTELIPGVDTDPELVNFLMDWCAKKQQRVMITAYDRPGFAGNRVGFKVLNEVAQMAEEHGSVLMDYLIGPYTGRALAPLATIDLVGWDVHKAIVDNVVKHITPAEDEALATYQLPDYMAKLIDQGVLGNKSGGGFFKRIEKVPHFRNFKTGEYEPVASVKKPKLDFIEQMRFFHSLGQYDKAMKIFATAQGKEAEIAQKVIGGYISYGFHRVPEVAETITGVDLIMGMGFNWAPPSVLVDTMGVDNAINMIKKVGVPVPAALEAAQKEGRTEPFFNVPNVNIGKFFVAK